MKTTDLFELISFFILHLILFFSLTVVGDWFLFFVVSVVWCVITHRFAAAIVYHKLFAHRSFTPIAGVALIGTLISVLSFKGSPQIFSLIHRIHHRYADTDLDPHTPKDHWYVGYFGIHAAKRILRKFSDNEQRRILNDVFRDFSWIKYFNGRNTFLIPVIFYVALWYINQDFFAAILFGSLLSIHMMLVQNVMAHKPTIKDYPVLALLVASTWNHYTHHDNPGYYSDAGPERFELEAWIIKKFLSANYKAKH